jgi:hypothetical protein
MSRDLELELKGDIYIERERQRGGSGKESRRMSRDLELKGKRDWLSEWQQEEGAARKAGAWACGAPRLAAAVSNMRPPTHSVSLSLFLCGV